MAVDSRSAAAAGPLYGAELLQEIQDQARLVGVDPFVALAIVPHEGGLDGAVGDGGTSFGPWQLHAGGALPAVFAGHPQEARAWANSPAGVRYALQGIKQAIGGAVGTNAVTNVVRNFERPADPAKEDAAARVTYYRLLSAGQNDGRVDPEEWKAVQGTGLVTNRSASDAGSYDLTDAGKDAAGALTGWAGELVRYLNDRDVLARVGVFLLGGALVVVGLRRVIA